MPYAATWMDLEIVILSEVRQRKKNIIRYHVHVESKIQHKSTYLQNRKRPTDIEDRLAVLKGEGGVGTGEVQDWQRQICHPITCRMDKQQSPTVQHRKLLLI